MTATRRPDSPTRERANELIRAWDGRPGPLGSLLGRVTAVDEVGVEQRVDALRRRSIKKASKVWALELAISMMDLTTLEGKDTPGKIRALCAKGMHPQPGDPTIPSVAAICVYPALVADAKDAL
ncbi:MAG: deoxyribose-phosphate aldolase, partial [Chloroflexota bacterium]